MDKINDYDYLISIINYVNIYYHLNLKVSNKDFDIMYRWWEKNIPINIIRTAIDEVLKNRKDTNKIKSFSTFNYRVKKEFERFLSFSIGENPNTDDKEARISKTEEFMKNLPKELVELKELFKEYYNTRDEKIRSELENLLLDKFSENNELKINIEIFLSKISKSLINEKLIKRYKINYIINKLSIPEF